MPEKTLDVAESAGGWLLILREPGKVPNEFWTQDEKLLAFWNACRNVVAGPAGQKENEHGKRAHDDLEKALRDYPAAGEGGKDAETR